MGGDGVKLEFGLHWEHILYHITVETLVNTHESHNSL